MSRLSYKIIGFIFSKLSGPRAYPSLARGYGPDMGLKLAGRAGPGPNIHGLGRAWAYILVCGLNYGLQLEAIVSHAQCMELVF